MKNLNQIIKEKKETKKYYATYIIDVKYEFESTDMTEAGKVAENQMDVISEKLGGADVSIEDLSLNEIDVINESKKINESYKEIDDGEATILNDYADSIIDADVVDIFDIVEKRINNSKYKQETISSLIKKLNEMADDDYDYDYDYDYDVVFKILNGEVIALFPNEKWSDRDDTILSYMHVGQHGPASRDFLDELEDADDYSELYDELISLGYNLNVLNESK